MVTNFLWSLQGHLAVIIVLPNHSSWQWCFIYPAGYHYLYVLHSVHITDNAQRHSSSFFVFCFFFLFFCCKLHISLIRHGWAWGLRAINFLMDKYEFYSSPHHSAAYFSQFFSILTFHAAADLDFPSIASADHFSPIALWTTYLLIRHRQLFYIARLYPIQMVRLQFLVRYRRLFWLESAGLWQISLLICQIYTETTIPRRWVLS